jgi:hypothetical protein
MKNVLKALAVQAARTLGATRGAPIVLGYTMSRLLIGRERAFLGATEAVARIPGLLGIYSRSFVYSRLLAHVGS